MITITGYNEDWPKRFGEIRDCLRSELEGVSGGPKLHTCWSEPPRVDSGGWLD